MLVPWPNASRPVWSKGFWNRTIMVPVLVRSRPTHLRLRMRTDQLGPVVSGLETLCEMLLYDLFCGLPSSVASSDVAVAVPPTTRRIRFVLLPLPLAPGARPTFACAALRAFFTD